MIFFPEVFFKYLRKEDRIEMEPVVVDLVPNHEEIKVFHPNLSTDVPAYLQKAAEKELQRMLAGGLLEPISGYTEHVSRGFFVEKNSKPGEPVKVRLVADFRGINKKLQRPEHPLDLDMGHLPILVSSQAARRNIGK